MEYLKIIIFKKIACEEHSRIEELLTQEYKTFIK